MLELVVVIIIIAVLASLAFSQYTKLLERGRASEARTILGQLRTAQAAYFLEYGGWGAFNSTANDLGVDAPTSCGQNTHYFRYWCIPASSLPGECDARRCTSGGKPPPGSEYTIYLGQDGIFGGDLP